MLLMIKGALDKYNIIPTLFLTVEWLTLEEMWIFLAFSILISKKIDTILCQVLL